MKRFLILALVFAMTACLLAACRKQPPIGTTATHTPTTRPHTTATTTTLPPDTGTSSNPTITNGTTDSAGTTDATRRHEPSTTPARGRNVHRTTPTF